MKLMLARNFVPSFQAIAAHRSSLPRAFQQIQENIFLLVLPAKPSLGLSFILSHLFAYKNYLKIYGTMCCIVLEDLYIFDLSNRKLT
jgi:hypothetical protein